MSVPKRPGSGQNPKCRSMHTLTADVAHWTRFRLELQTRVKTTDMEDTRVWWLCRGLG